MMRPVRIYLLLCSNKVEWVSSVHRDLDEVLAAWDTARKNAETVAIVHVGISRPSNSAFGNVAAGMSNCAIFTTNARWVFDSVGTYSEAVDDVEGLGLHIALSGWGPVHPDILDIARSHQSAREAETRVYTSPWLTYLDEINPKIARESWSLGVRDDASYCAIEKSLQWDMRHAVGTARMDYLMRVRDSEDPIQVATSCPPWLIDTPIDLIDATVRCSNALRSAGIVLVADLLQLTMDDLLKIQNFGRKSLKDLAIALRSAAQRGPLAGNICGETYERVGKAGGVSKFLIEDKAELKDSCTDKPPSRRFFKSAFESIKSRLKENQASILSQRIGCEGEKMTLMEISEEIGITRERVRQIETDAIEIFRADGVWKSELAARLDDILRDRADPLPAQSLGIFDPWFAGVENMMPEFEFIIDRVLEDQFFVLDINGCKFVTHISRSEWRRAVREGGFFLERAAQDKISKSKARRGVEELLSSKGAELASELWASVQAMALFAVDQDGVERVVGVGTGAESMVAAILAASDRPLHYSELPKRIQDAFGRSVDVRRAHNAARNIGLLLGRGTFGTVRHCPLTLEEMDILREETEEIILSGSKGRQWSCFELVEKLSECALDFEDRINQYVVHIALHDSSLLSNLGRFVWTQSGDRPSGTQDRIDITQATLSVLQSAGRPMTRNEIRAALLRDRGLSGYFQIHPRGSLVKTSADRWGILERDIPLSDSEMRNTCSSATALLEGSQRGLHLTEIKQQLGNIAAQILRLEDPQAIFSVLLTDQKFKSSTSGYIYLASWDGPRRLSQGEAVIAALRKMGLSGFKASDLAKQAAEILGRTVEKESVYATITACGAKFNEETGRWAIHDADESDVEIGDEVE